MENLTFSRKIKTYYRYLHLSDENVSQKALQVTYIKLDSRIQI